MVVDANGMSHKPKGLPQRVAGNYDGRAFAVGDGDLNDPEPPAATPEPWRLPLKPTRAKPRPLAATDDAPAARRKLANFTRDHMDGEAMDLAGEAIAARWPGAGEIAMDGDYWTESIAKLHPGARAWRVEDEWGADHIIAVYPDRADDRSLARTMRAVDGTPVTAATPQSLMASIALADGMGERDDDRLLALIACRPKDPMVAALTPPKPPAERPWARLLMQELPGFPPPPDDWAHARAWMDETKAKLESRAWQGARLNTAWSFYYDVSQNLEAGLAAEAFRRSAAALLGGDERHEERPRRGRAGLWDDARHDRAHLEAARTGPFADAFDHVEIDDRVDLDDYRAWGEAYRDVERLLGRPPKGLTLRFRRIRGRATGKYNNAARALVVDSPSPDAFVHELIHAVDFDRGLVHDPEFQELADAYRANIPKNLTADDRRYLGDEREILAWAGSDWAARHGLDGSPLADPPGARERLVGYRCCRGLEDRIDRFFDRVFGDA